MEGHGCEQEGDPHPSAQALTDCGGFHRQSLVEVDLLGKAVGMWDVPGQRHWAEEGEVSWNRRCVDHLWVGHGWHYSLEEAEEGLSGRAVVRQCWRKQLDAHPEDLVLREAEHPLLAPVSAAPTAE